MIDTVTVSVVCATVLVVVVVVIEVCGVRVFATVLVVVNAEMEF